ncbi:MAG: sigma-70 family RNA polymerase sigma factor [Pseudomonadales bacterium]
MQSDNPVTELLARWRSGEQRALNELTPLVYDELHRLAVRLFQGERPDHTLQPTAVINEAFLRLADARVAWQDRAHFFALAARMMRRVLIDHANARNAQKRGGNEMLVTLSDDTPGGEFVDLGLLDLERALTELTELDARKAEVMEMRLFAGLSYEELSEVTGLSTSTLDREIRFSKAWLGARLQGERPALPE